MFISIKTARLKVHIIYYIIYKSFVPKQFGVMRVTRRIDRKIVRPRRHQPLDRKPYPHEQAEPLDFYTSQEVSVRVTGNK